MEPTDLYDNFDKSLYKLEPLSGTSSFNPENTDLRGEAVLSETLDNSQTKNPSKVYDAIVDAAGGTPWTTIEKAIDYVTTLGGGTIFVLAGTYTPLASSTIQVPLKIIGENSALVTIDFMSTSRQFAVTSKNIYSTGTITSITSGVNVTGSGTSWLANVSAGYQIFLGTRWYTIAAVTSDTTLILAESYGDNLTMPALAYRIANLTSGIEFSGMTVKSSTTTAIAITDARNVVFKDFFAPLNNKGIVLTNVSQCNVDIAGVFSSTSNGIELTNCGLFNIKGLISAGNGGHGYVLNNCKTIPLTFSASDSNISDGFNCTDVVNCVFKVEASGNGGQGIEFVSGCNNNFIDDSLVVGNTSDGIKLTATSSNNTIGADISITNNGGYGINIAAGCNNNIIILPYYTTNTSGNLNDLGTGTVVAIGKTTTDTLTNKRITKRVLALSAGSATPAINTDSYDVVHITAQSAAITSFTTNLTGTPVDGDTLRISITDNGTARALTWGASFEASLAALPTTTVISTRLDVGFFWNTETTKWRCVGSA